MKQFKIDRRHTLATTLERAREYLRDMEVHENFGVGITREIEDVYIDKSNYSTNMNTSRDLMNEFRVWCGES